jgi:osmotically-inducible protein OsmY
MKFMTLALLLAMLAAPVYVATAQESKTSKSATETPLTQSDLERITREVRHQLVLLPYYSVFDNLAYKVSPDGTVTLLGEVRKPVLKSDAGNVVKRVEGVSKVDNQIKVLPLSTNDDRIRIAEYRTIYRQPALSQYAMRAVPPIHIIVDNGHVTLEGVVASQGDKNIAGIQANTVPGVFSVTNNLRVEKD